MNPYLSALKAIAIGACAAGVVLLLVGSTLANQQPWNVFSGTAGFAGLPQMLWGAWLLSLGLFSAFLWLHAAAVLWKRAAAEPEPATASRGVAAETR